MIEKHIYQQRPLYYNFIDLKKPLKEYGMRGYGIPQQVMV